MGNITQFFEIDNQYENKKDNELISMIKDGDQKALNFLIQKYKEIVNMKVGKYFIVGAEREDIIQEGMIGLFKAIKNFKPEMQNSFKTFANLCIERQLITAIKTSNRQKHMPLNSYLSLNATAYEEDENTSIMEILNTDSAEDPLETITKKEYYEIVENTIDKSLSDFEKQVLNKYIQGQTYISIAEELNTPVKSIDNAIQRIRKKAVKNITEEL